MRDEAMNVKKVCNACIACANPVSSISTTNSTRSRSRSSSNGSQASGGAPSQDTKLLQSLSERMDKLLLSVSSIDTRLGTMETSVLAVTGRVSTVENELQSLQKEVRDIKSDMQSNMEKTNSKLDDLQADRNGEKGTSSLCKKTEALESANTILTQQLHQVRSQLARLTNSTELIIGGLSLTDETDLKKAAFAVFNSIELSFNVDDIVSARALPAKPTSTPPVSADSVASNNATNSQSALFRSLVVTVRTAAIAKQLLRSRASKGKITSSSLTERLVAEAGLPRGTNNINVRELLPKDLFILKNHVYKESRNKKNNFVTFMRDGCIYVRKKDSDEPVLITSTKDLKDFLGTGDTTHRELVE